MRKHPKKLALVALLAAALVLYAAGVLPDLPDLEQLVEDLAQTLGPWTYALVGVAAFLETGAFVGLVAPGETTVILGGVIAGQGEVELLALIGLVWLSCVLGDSTSFFVGRRLGRGFLLRHGPKVRLDEPRLARVESYFERHGGKTILIGRFVGLVRAVAPFVAGSSGLAYSRFVPFSVIGCGLWAALFTILGYLFYRSFDRVAAVAGQATLAFAMTVGIAVGGVYAYRRLRREQERRRLGAWFERQGRRRALRPVYALARPVLGAAAPRLRFVRDRLTPGDLGLELTTALAVAGSGLFLFLLYATALSGGERLTPADSELLDLAGELRGDAGVDAVKLVTELGSFATVATLVCVAAIVLGVRRRFSELAALVAGSLLVFVGVQLAKAGVDRPRPAGPLATAHGSSFPSGHAAYSTIWIGVAVLLTRVVPGVAKDAGLVLAAVAVAAAVGLSRMYLRVHYWSDVVGGWGLGIGLLGASAAIVFVVGHIRHNARHPAAAADPPRERA